jgi:hypothetical protein
MVGSTERVVRRRAYLIPVAFAALTFVTYLLGVVHAPITPIPWDPPSVWSGFTPLFFLMVAISLLSLVIIAFLRRPPVDMAVPTPHG